MKTIAKAFGVGMLGMIGLTGCSSDKYLSFCDGKNMRYDNIEILANSDEGQRLVKIDGRFYVGDASEDCLINYYAPSNTINYTLEGNQKILTIKDTNNIFRMIWGRDGSFHKEIIVN